MKKDNQTTLIVECQNCTSKGKLIIPENFDWNVVPCPICLTEDLEKVETDREIDEKEIDFTFNPKGVDQESEED